MKLNQALLAKAAGVDSFAEICWKQLQQHADLVFETNSKVNLVSRAGDASEEIARQVALSLIADRLVAPLPSVMRCLDVGSGGGFPAIPLAILHPGVRFTLVESVAKKAYFLERAADTIRLNNVHVAAARIEDLLASPTETIVPTDLLSVKAVTDLKETCDWARRCLRPGGFVLTYKPPGDSLDTEGGFSAIGLELVDVLNVKSLLDFSDIRILLLRKP